MELSARLQAVADLITPGGRVADIGTDHGFIPVYMLEAQRAVSAIAMDVNKGPLQRAQQTIALHNMEEKIETRLSNGMQHLAPGEADSAVIAGMGGALTITILEQSPETVDSLQELILQPQSEIGKVRSWLYAHGWQIAAENMIFEDGKYYPMMRAVHGKAQMPDTAELLYGPMLLADRHPVLRRYLDWESGIFQGIAGKLEAAKGDGAAERKEELAEKIRCNAAAKRLMEA